MADINLVEVDIRSRDLTGPGFASALARAEALKKAMQAGSFLGFDMQKVDGELSLLRSKLQSHGVADLLDINMNQGKIDSQLLLLKRRVQDAHIGDLLDVNIHKGDIVSQLAEVEQAIADANVPLSVQPVLTGNVDLSNLPQFGPAEKIRISGGVDPSTIESVDKLTTGLEDLDAAAAAAAGSGGAGGGGIAGLTAAAGSSGRRIGLWGLMVGTAVGHVKLWHVALDTAMESAIALGSAVAALTVGVAAMVPAAQDIYTHLKSVSTVNSALGSSIPPLTGKFSALAQAMAPQTIEAYGGALGLVNSKSGIMAKVAGEVVTGIDNLVAKLDVWNGKQKHTGQLLQDGVGFLSQFESILGSVGQALSHLVKADPGTAHMLLDIVGAGAKLLDWATRIPTPMLGAALAIHSVYIWGNVAAGALGKLVGLVPGLSKVAGVLSKGFGPKTLLNPAVLGVGLLVAAIADIAVNWDKADAATRAAVNAMNTKLANMPASQAILTMSQDIGTLNHQIQTAFSPASIAAINKTWNALGSWGMALAADFKADMHDWAQYFRGSSHSFIGSFEQLGKAISGIFAPGQGEAQVAANNVAAYRAEIGKLVGGQGALLAETGHLMKSGYSMSQAWGIMDLAGVRVTDTLQVMRQKVANLVTGYKNMSVTGGMLANSVHAVTFASLQQSSKVSALNSAWDAFFTTISGGESGFTAFGQAVQALDKSLTVTTKSAGGAAVATSTLTSAQASLTSAQGSVASAQSYLNKLLTSGKATALQLTAAHDRLTAAQQRESAAQQRLTGLQNKAVSVTTTQAVSITGLSANSLKARQAFLSAADAANKQMDSLTTLASAAGLGDKGTAMLAQATKDLMASLLPAAKDSAALTTVLYALAQRGGYQGADSFKALSKWVGSTKDPMRNLDGIVTTLTVDAGNLTTDVQNLSTALGQKLNGAMAQVILTESGGLKPMEQLYAAIKTTGLNSNATKNAAASLAGQYYKLTGNVASAKDEFVTFAEKALGKTKSQADILWQKTLPALQGQINKLHGKNVDVGVHATGSGVIWAQTKGLKSNIRDSISIFSKAGGGPVTGAGGPTQDNIPVMASSGEYVVKASSVSKYGLGLLDALNAGKLGPWAAHDLARFGAAATVREASVISGALLKALKAGLGMTGGSGGGTEAQNKALARSLMPAWASGEQWAAWDYLWTRESGWNQYAMNPASGAYGIPQALPYTKMPKAAWPASAGGSSSPRAQEGWGVSYIQGRYGSPYSAALHEQNYGWYSRGGPVFDSGGWLRPGWNPPVYNGTGAPEHLVPSGRGVTVTLEVAPGGDSDFDKFMSVWLRKFVRVKGGGDVQKAMGRY